MKRLIIGCGYLGRRVARLWREAGDEVLAVTRSPQHAAEFAQEGLAPLVAEVTAPASLAAIGQQRGVDTLLFAVGFDRTAAPSIEQVYAEGFRNVLNAAPDDLQRVIYISTTGVYGPADGAWVDERTSPNPQRDGGRASLLAEQALAESRFADRGTVLRLAGIYGPLRVPFLKELQAGQPIAAPEHGWLNLIHVDDAAPIVTCAARTENGSQLFCVCDGSPVRRRDYYGQVASLIGAAPPVFVEPPEDSPRAARAKSDRRVSNSRLLSALPVDLRYPSYVEGLSSILGTSGANG